MSEKNALPILNGLISSRGMSKTFIADKLGITPRTLYHKLNGETSFTWDEVCKIQKDFFPDYSKERLMSSEMT